MTSVGWGNTAWSGSSRQARIGYVEVFLAWMWPCKFQFMIDWQYVATFVSNFSKPWWDIMGKASCF
jgi:hypothetical protein